MLTDEYEYKIELKIKNLLEGKSLQNWCKDISNNFLVETEQTTPPFSITKFLPHRNIKALHDENLSLTGKIEKKQNGFLLKLNPKKIKSGQYYNFVLAHEIAHTFFYDVNSPEPIDISGLVPSSFYLEYLCNKIARYLLIPAKSIEEEIENIPSIESYEFNLSYVSILLEKYNTSSFTFLTRIIVDEPLWNAVFIRFKYFDETSNWKLTETYKPRYLNPSEFFIPLPDKNKHFDNPHKFPTAKSNLNSFLQELYKDLLVKKRLNKIIDAKEIKGAPLETFLNKFPDDFKLLLHTSVHKETNTINILIPLSNFMNEETSL